MCTKKIQTALFFAMFLCFGIIQVHSQALDIVNSTGDTLLHVENDGNVGIGETGPTAKLEIKDGDVSVTNSSTNQRVRVGLGTSFGFDTGCVETYGPNGNILVNNGFRYHFTIA